MSFWDVLNPIVGALGGGITSLITGWMKYKDEHLLREHEYRMTQLQLEVDKARASQAIDLAQVQGLIAQNAAEMAAYTEAIKSQSQITGVRFIDGINAALRPLLTVWWCIGLYTVAKGFLIAQGIQWNVSLINFADLILTDFDRAVVSMILGFWFVNRTLEKHTPRK